MRKAGPKVTSRALRKDGSWAWGRPLSKPTSSPVPFFPSAAAAFCLLQGEKESGQDLVPGPQETNGPSEEEEEQEQEGIRFWALRTPQVLQVLDSTGRGI